MTPPPVLALAAVFVLPFAVTVVVVVVVVVVVPLLALVVAFEFNLFAAEAFAAAPLAGAFFAFVAGGGLGLFTGASCAAPSAVAGVALGFGLARFLGAAGVFLGLAAGLAVAAFVTELVSVTVGVVKILGADVVVVVMIDGADNVIILLVESLFVVMVVGVVFAIDGGCVIGTVVMLSLHLAGIMISLRGVSESSSSSSSELPRSTPDSTTRFRRVSLSL